MSDVVVSVDGVEVRWVSGGSLAVLRSSFKVPVAGLQTVGETRPGFSRRTAGRLRMFTIERAGCAGCNADTG